MLVSHLGISANFPLPSSAVSLWRFVAVAVGTPLKKVIDLNASETIIEIKSFASFLGVSLNGSKMFCFQNLAKLQFLGLWRGSPVSSRVTPCCRPDWQMKTYLALLHTIWMIAKDYWIGRIKWGGSLAKFNCSKVILILIREESICIVNHFQADYHVGWCQNIASWCSTTWGKH